jgi:hypothetical protein
MSSSHAFGIAESELSSFGIAGSELSSGIRTISSIFQPIVS